MGTALKMVATHHTFLVAKTTKKGYLVVGPDGGAFEFQRHAIERGISTGQLEKVEPTWAVLQWRLPS